MYTANATAAANIVDAANTATAITNVECVFTRLTQLFLLVEYEVFSK